MCSYSNCSQREIEYLQNVRKKQESGLLKVLILWSIVHLSQFFSFLCALGQKALAYFFPDLSLIGQGDRNESGFGMVGNESNPASLFRLYVDHGRHTEATNLLIEYMENLASIVRVAFYFSESGHVFSFEVLTLILSIIYDHLILLTYYMQRPADIIRRKKPFAVWFPYTYVERLWGMLEESIRMGHRSDQCEKLKKLLHGALSNHLNLVC